ncbi:hypothetical protein PHJA_000092700 [Phtheirospermum japonicum]|uniref:Protein BIG GRAIN 1-like B n=1 Tax=Phtheirospermum japonicum TaxID=374723 RepID=A0A830B1Z9_9LAMI|nr:hypothetical protein PHJA_000092700 [Phtheirospermum japonicum]
MIEEWIDNYSSATTTSTPRHLPSNSGSSTDSSAFSSSTETESSVSKSTPRPKNGKFASTKSRAQKIYGDLKKVKEPISPGGKIANFLNSIFSPRNLKASQAGPEEWGGPVIKSRSVNGKSVNVTKMSSVIKSRSLNDTKTTRSCLSRNQFSRGSSSNNNSNKSKRSVRFCPEINDFDDMSCASSDLFELENIGRAGVGSYEEDQLPVYGSTSFKMNTKVIW